MTMTDEQIQILANAIRLIAHGTESGPTGLESPAMALAGEGTPGVTNLLAGLDGISTALEEVAHSIQNVADAINEHHAT